jgi:hypothetical protein
MPMASTKAPRMQLATLRARLRRVKEATRATMLCAHGMGGGEAWQSDKQELNAQSSGIGAGSKLCLHMTAAIRTC